MSEEGVPYPTGDVSDALREIDSLGEAVGPEHRAAPEIRDAVIIILLRHILAALNHIKDKD